jgi:pimeloyl-ACP methyl ester carboxylesterase
MRNLTFLAIALIAFQAAAPAAAMPIPRAVVADPPRDARFPAHNQQLLIPSHGLGMNAVLFEASGKGPHHTVILMHGLPGNERNLDLAQAIRRTGWDVLTFTYRGAWGSPGDFSIAGAMEDTKAALDFARSPEAAKLGIDAKHIVLAGHSMGGATAMMTAAGATGLDGLILIDAWNIAAGTSKGATTRAELVSGFDDFGNSLHGATPESVADEVIANRSQWDLVATAPRLARLPILTVTAKYGGAMENRPTTAALRAAGNRRVTAIEMDTDHPFSDHRIALAAAVVGWLQRLEPSHR